MKDKKLPVLIASSVNENKISFTLKGAITMIVIMALRSTDIDLSANEITATIEAMFMIAGGLAVIAGTLRKLWVGFKLDR